MTSLFLADIHLNGGGPRENFFSDKLLVRLLRQHLKDRIYFLGDFCEERQASYREMWGAHPFLLSIIGACTDLVVLPGNHDPHIERALWWPSSTLFPGKVYVDKQGVLSTHGSIFDLFTGGHLSFIGTAATWLASTSTLVFGSSADEWLSNTAQTVLGYGKHGDLSRYVGKMKTLLLKYNAKRGVLGHLHCSAEEGAVRVIADWKGPAPEVEKRFEAGKNYLILED